MAPNFVYFQNNSSLCSVIIIKDLVMRSHLPTAMSESLRWARPLICFLSGTV